MKLEDAKETQRKALLMKARIDEVKHNLRSQLDKEKKHQWYIYRRKNYPYSRDTTNQRDVEREINPDGEESAIVPNIVPSSFPMGSVVAASVAISAAFLLLGNHMNMNIFKK